MCVLFYWSYENTPPELRFPSVLIGSVTTNPPTNPSLMSSSPPASSPPASWPPVYPPSPPCTDCRQERWGPRCEFCNDPYCENCAHITTCDHCGRYCCQSCFEKLIEEYKGRWEQLPFFLVKCTKCTSQICASSEACSGLVKRCQNHREVLKPNEDEAEEDNESEEEENTEKADAYLSEEALESLGSVDDEEENEDENKEKRGVLADA